MRVLGRLRRFEGVRGDGAGKADRPPAGLCDTLQDDGDAAVLRDGPPAAAAGVCARNLPGTIRRSACKAVRYTLQSGLTTHLL